MMYYPDVPALEPDELELLCHEYLEHNATLDPHLADQMGVKRGLRNLDGTGRAGRHHERFQRYRL